jgi:hypothetical protein
MRPADYFLLGGTGGSTPAGPLGRLTTSGVNFLDAGKPWKYRAVTAFTLFETIVRDRLFDAPFVRWARSLGANTVRVFGMWSVTGFDPRLFSSLAMLDTLCASLLDEDMRLHFVAFTDQITGSSVLMPSDEQNTWLQQVNEVLRRYPNTFCEPNNEDWKNGGIAGRFPAEWFNGVMSTRSSWEDGNTPLEAGSVLDFTTEHTPRGDGWERKSKNLLETSRLGIGEKGQPGYFPPSNKPAIAGEPNRLEDSTPRQYADYVAVAELFASGACLHGLGLERCQIPADDRVARAVAAVWADPPPADLAASGTYVRGQKDGGGPCPIAHSDDLALRTFAMIAGNRATAVVVSPRTGWSLQPVNGWRVTRVYGYDGNTVDLER